VWSVRRSWYLYKDAWLAVRAEDVVTSSGVSLAPYYTFEYPDFVHVFATTRDEQCVLVRQYRHGARSLSLELPGGMMDVGDSSPAHTAARELAEETGYTGDLGQTLAVLSPDPAKLRNRLHLIQMTNVELGTAAPEDSEEIEVICMRREQLLEATLGHGIISAPHVAMILLACMLT
jgi:8-oxo-dGTP pyrophosphatase MutT (NUDIX family)